MDTNKLITEKCIYTAEHGYVVKMRDVEHLMRIAMVDGMRTCLEMEGLINPSEAKSRCIDSVVHSLSRMAGVEYRQTARPVAPVKEKELYVDDNGDKQLDLNDPMLEEVRELTAESKKIEKEFKKERKTRQPKENNPNKMNWMNLLKHMSTFELGVPYNNFKIMEPFENPNENTLRQYIWILKDQGYIERTGKHSIMVTKPIPDYLPSSTKKEII